MTQCELIISRWLLRVGFSLPFFTTIKKLSLGKGRVEDRDGAGLL